jgi:hypothetical protein
MHETTAPCDARRRLTIGSCLLAVAMVATILALVAAIRRAYEAVPSYASPAYPESLAMPAILLWVILTSIAAYAWRGATLDRLVAQVAISNLLVLTRFSFTSSQEFKMVWPVGCFGLFVVVPLLIRRFGRVGPQSERIEGASLLLVDSAIGALLVSLFAGFVPGI